jgi:hypothetical protein
MHFVSNFISEELIKSASELNKKEDMSVKYHPYSDDWGYWTIDNVWKDFNSYIELSSHFPATPPYKKVNYSNWFHKQIILKESVDQLFSLMKIFNQEYIRKDVLIFDYFTWANIFDRKKSYKVPRHNCYPHADTSIENNTVIFSYWLSPEPNGGTAFWKFDESYTLSEDDGINYNTYLQQRGNEIVEFYNIDDDDRFQKVSQSPSNCGQIIVYTGAQYHSPVIDFNKDTRWSHLMTGHA